MNENIVYQRIYYMDCKQLYDVNSVMMYFVDLLIDTLTIEIVNQDMKYLLS